MLINEMAIFYTVVQLKSFSKTAEKLGLSKSFISKHINQLEKDLKTRLLSRSTRQLSLTEAGEVFYQHCETLFEQAQQGYESIANMRKQPIGTLKISAPPAFGAHVLAHSLSQFNQKYPDVKLNVILESHLVDVIQEGYDIVLRSAVLPDSNLIAQKITTIRNVLCASPSYLKKRGLIKHPEELIKHVFASYNCNPTFANQIKLTHSKQSFSIKINSPFQSNNLDLIAQMAIAGDYMAVLPEFMAKPFIKKKKLVVCLPSYRLIDNPIYAVYPERKFIPLKVKMFIEILKKHLPTIC